MSNFIKDVVSGSTHVDMIDHYIEDWHTGDSNVELHVYLGMTKSEYSKFLNDSDALIEIIMENLLEQGTKIDFKIDDLEGTGIITGYYNLEFADRIVYILQPEKRIDDYNYSHIILLSRHITKIYENYYKLIGDRVHNGRARAKGFFGLGLRILKENGKDCAMTDDLRTDRLNVEVENGRITKIIGVF